ncbi:CUGBP Elav-like family member 4 [Durusdinium trenchii]|uniref:CUGBP Elav-like family member 4 n=1 Tax=Durusdinium trenchii TaxID=1381693 RepID=A0ABP0R3K7_9DINO
MEYGSVEGKQSSFTPGKRKRLNVVAILVSLLTPCAVFCGVFVALSFQLHYWSPSISWFSVTAGLALAGTAGFLARRNQIREQDPTWFTFAALAYLFATVFGAILGDMNYWYNMQPFYDIENINSYPDVNPARERGQQLMDAGRVYFEDGTGLDISKSMSFKNLDRYCVAPIVHGQSPLDSYDFWAVGLNCCGSSTGAFQCGEYNNPKAHAGLRLMQEEQRPFFRLAVQQAEAAYNIKANHPLFFYWMQDPVAEILHYKTSGFAWALIAIATHFAFNLLCVAGAALAFSKLAQDV